MNNYRLPPGDLSIQLPFTVPAGNPNNTLYKQLLLIGIDLNQTPLGQLPVLTVDRRRIIFKHDYYDRALQFHSRFRGRNGGRHRPCVGRQWMPLA